MAEEGPEELPLSPTKSEAKPEQTLSATPEPPPERLKHGLRAALAARLDKWSERLKKDRQEFLDEEEKLEAKTMMLLRSPENMLVALRQNILGMIPVTNPLFIAGTLLLAEKTTALLRDRLQPKSKAREQVTPQKPTESKDQ